MKIFRKAKPCAMTVADLVQPGVELALAQMAQDRALRWSDLVQDDAELAIARNRERWDVCLPSNDPADVATFEEWAGRPI